MAIFKVPKRIQYKNTENLEEPQSKVSDKLQKHIDTFEDETNIEIIDNSKSLEELEKQLSNWKSMSKRERKLSDDKCMAIYGKTNMNMYYDLKTDLDEKNKSLEDDFVTYKPVTENFFFTKNDNIIDFDKFKNGQSKILLITGLTGSGKTTLAKEIAKDNKATVIELDVMDYNTDLMKCDYKKLIPGDKIIYKYIKEEKPELKSKDIRTIKDYDVYCNYFDDFLKWLNKYAQKTNTKYVVEGIRIYDTFDLNQISEYPLIIKNTSTTKSFFQRWKREGKGKVNWINQMTKVGNNIDLMRWYNDDNKLLKRFKADISTLNLCKPSNLENDIEKIKEEGDLIKLSTSLIKTGCSKKGNITEDAVIDRIIDDGIKYMKDDICNVFDFSNNLPYFEPEQMINMGVFEPVASDNYYGCISDAYDRLLDETKKITSKEWFDNYILLSKGIYTDSLNEFTTLWINKIKSLQDDIKKLNESENVPLQKVNKKKQSLLELGWNPELQFIPEVRHKITENTRNKFKARNSDVKVFDLTSLTSNMDDSMITEATEDKQMYPIYVILTFTGTKFGKAVKFYTKSKYSHCALSLDSDMDRLYTFNMTDNGFTIENMKKYNQNGNIVIYTMFVSKKNLLKLKTKIDYYLANYKHTKYSILNILGIIANKSINITNDMICSQFVDSMLKSIGVNLTNKQSSLVTPDDFYHVKYNKTFFKIYEGSIGNYNKSKLDKIVKSIQTKNKYIKEGVEILNESQFANCIDNCNDINTLLYLDDMKNVLSESNRQIFDNHISPCINIINEAKEFPVQFDNDGNLLIKKIKSLDFNQEYSKSHKLLKVYSENKNIEGLKYELSKLWFLNEIVEKKISSASNAKDKKKLFDSRARILNDFTKYLKDVTKEDNSFNFTDYYNNSPFSDVTIKVNNSTLKYGAKLLNVIAKLYTK